MPKKAPPGQRQLFDDDDLPAPKKDKRIRVRFNFWLDMRSDAQLLLAEYIDYLKSERSYAPTIRQALNLIWSLRERKVDFLLELFPWIEDHFRNKFAQDESPAVSEFVRVMERQSAILEQLASRSGGQPVGASRAFSVPEIDLSSSIFAEDAEPVERGNLAANMGDLFADEDDDDLFDD